MSRKKSKKRQKPVHQMQREKRLTRWASLSPKQKELVRHVQQRLDDKARIDMMFAWELAMLLNRTCQQKCLMSLYPMAEVVGVKPAYLIHLSMLPYCYHKIQVEQAAEIPMSDGGHITIDHLFALARVSDHDDRIATLNKAIEESWSLAKLRKMINAMDRDRRSGPNDYLPVP